MNTIKTSGIFTFDHDYQKLNKAIGVEEDYLDNLGEQVAHLLKDFLFDGNKDIKDDISPSKLVELTANEFSYSQLVILTSFYLHDKIDDFAKKLDGLVDDMKSSVRAIKLDSDDFPDNIKQMLEDLAEGNSKGNLIDEDSLPPELSNFLKKLAEEQRRKNGDGDEY